MRGCSGIGSVTLSLGVRFVLIERESVSFSASVLVDSAQSYQREENQMKTHLFGWTVLVGAAALLLCVGGVKPAYAHDDDDYDSHRQLHRDLRGKHQDDHLKLELKHDRDHD